MEYNVFLITSRKFGLKNWIKARFHWQNKINFGKQLNFCNTNTEYLLLWEEHLNSGKVEN
jgi:hypothetical protein